MTSNAAACRFFFEELREAHERAPANERIERFLEVPTSAAQPTRAPQRSSHRFQCRICPSIIAQNPSRGYMNLMNHLRARHPAYEQTMQTMVAETAITYACSEKAKAAFGWIDWIVGGELPLNFCENELTRKNAGLSPNSKATLKKYLTALVALVEGSLSIIAGELYALLFDGWSAGSDHFVAVFICYTKGGERKRHLLAFASLIDETNQTAPNHKDFILRTLERFNIDPRGAVCLSGDNCATNISTARLLGVPLVGCSSHRLNLAPERVFKKYEVELNLIAAVMRKLSTTKASGHLRRLAPLKPVRRNAIRWSSTFDMVDRFLEILVPARTVMLQVEDPALMPSPAQVARVKSLRKNELSIFQSVSMALQDECTSLADVRAIFEDVVEVLPETAHHLGTDAAIVKFRHFEDAIVKIQQGNQGELLAVELKAVRKLVASPTELNADGDVEDLGFAGRALKRRRLAAEQDHKFVDTTFLQPTSNAAERLFRWLNGSTKTSESVCCHVRSSSLSSYEQTAICGG